MRRWRGTGECAREDAAGRPRRAPALQRSCTNAVTRLISTPAARLSGTTDVPGDKSISHRALILGALAVGETVIEGLLEADDVQRTAAALGALGAEITRDDAGLWRVQGRGVGGLSQPASALDLGNAGTGLRLLMGVAASHPFTSFFAGDESLSRRPMDRIAAPLEMMGARIIARGGAYLPLAIEGARQPMPVTYALPVPSAQVKSAVLLAALNAPGESTVIESAPTRDHTERMLREFGAEVRIDKSDEGARITVVGQPELTPARLSVPGDPSSAAFVVVAGLIAPDAEVSIRNVGVNPRRTGLFDCLIEMGADMDLARRRAGGEEIADITVRSSALRGIEVPPGRAPTMIDEYPILAVAAACAHGTTVLRGLGELRLKESDRLAAMTGGLAACGVGLEQRGDDLVIHGCAGPPPGGATIATRLDHRIAMAFLVLGLAAREPVAVDDGTSIATSFPGFVELLATLGARLTGGAA